MEETKMDGTTEPVFEYTLYAQNAGTHRGNRTTARHATSRLRKAESSLAIQLRTEKVGFAAFLHARSP